MKFTLDNSLGFLINKVAKTFKRELHSLFRDKGLKLTPEHWAVLNRLWEQDGLQQSEIADQTFKDKATITRILDVMEKQGLIRRMRHEEDRRSFRILLTVEGRQLKNELIPLAKQVNKSISGHLTETEAETLKRLLRKIDNRK